jgi:hypothetical protein
MDRARLAPGEAAQALRVGGIEVMKEHTGDGTEIRCRCRDHQDPEGHLYVNAVTGAAFCHRCGLRTNLWALCGHQASLPLEQALRIEVLSAAAAYYHARLSEEAHRYLVEQRGLSPEVLDRFQVGWAGGGLLRHLVHEKGFALEACVATGVLRQDERGARDFYYDRIVFPNTVGGRVVHLSGRVLGEGKPKWLHLPGEIEYPFNADALRQPDCPWLEGIVDVLSAACWDMHAAAGLGTHVKEAWTAMVPEANRIIVALDGDGAGSRGSLTVAAALGERVRIATLPAGKDPNDLLVEGRREEFEACLRDAVDLLTFRIGQIPAHSPRTELPRLLGDVLKEIAARDPASAEAYLGVVKERFCLRSEEMRAYRQLVKQQRAAASKDSRADSGAGDWAYAATFDGLVDLAEDDGEPAFMLLDGDGRLQVAETAVRDERRLVPPPAEKIPWLLPRAAEVLRHHEEDSDGGLYDDLVVYHRGISELPGDYWYEFLALWVLHTYLLEHLNYSPELCLFAVPARGKSRTGKAIVYVSYRGIHVVSLREAYILRYASDFGGTIFFDIRSLWQKALREGSDDILLCRFERGLKVPRVQYPDRGPHQDTVYFDVFGPTVIGTNDPVHHILETRAVTIVMPEATRRFEQDVTPGAARPLRERLVAFRARRLRGVLPEAGKPAAGRLGDIMRPLRQIVRLVRPDREGAFLSFIQGLQQERLADRADSLEGALLRILDGLRDRVADGLLPVRLVTQAVNEGRSERDQIPAPRVGMKLRSLGFGKGGRDREGMLVRWNEDVLARNMMSYGLRDSTRSAHSTQPPPATPGDGPTGAQHVECEECADLEGAAGGSGAHVPPVVPASGLSPDEPPARPSQPCFACGGRRFWRHKSGGGWNCATCHPLASEDVVAERLEVGGEETTHV